MARIGLTRTPIKLATHTGQPAPSYRRLWDAAIAGKFPAEFENNRWTVDEDDLDVIAAAMGMTAPKGRKASPPARTVAAA